VSRKQVLSNISQRIIELRESKGWNQSDLARACGKDRQAIQKLESGIVNPTIYSLYEVAKALDVTVSKLTQNLEKGANS